MKQTLFAAALLLTAGCGSGTTPAPFVDPYHEPLPKVLSLNVGDRFPDVKVEGWLNMPPPPPGGGPKLHLYDVWGYWCPYCGDGAPNLIRLYNKYSPRGVAFVSFTNTGQPSVEAFNRNFKITWSNGYGAPLDSLIPLGASSGQGLSGYEVAPVVYLVGPDSKIVWTDKQARFRHVPPKDWEKEVEAALEAALAEKP